MTTHQAADELSWLRKRVADLEVALDDALNAAGDRPCKPIACDPDCRERSRAAVDVVPALICTGTQGGITFINGPGADLLGAASPEDMVGTPLSDLLGRDYRVLLEDDGGTWIEETTAAPIRLRRLNGDEFEVQGTTSTIGTSAGPELMLVAYDISERKQASEGLLQSEQRFEDFAEAASDWLWETGPDLCFSYFSPRFYTRLGVSPESIIGTPRQDFLRAENDDDWRQHLETLNQRQPFRDLLCRHTLPDGEVGYFSLSGKPFGGHGAASQGYRGTARDITELVLARHEAEKAQAQLQDAIESISESFELYDAEHRLVICNSHAREISHGVADLMVPGVALSTLMRAAVDRGLVDAQIDNVDAWVSERLANRRQAAGQQEIRLHDGRWIRLREYRTQEGGTVAIRTDITDLRHAEERLRESEKLSALGQLAGGVAHDFNNLLMIIHGYAKRVLDVPDDTERVIESLTAVADAAEKGKALTSQLLMFSRKKALEKRAFDAGKLLAELEGLLMPLLGETVDLTATTTTTGTDDLIVLETDPAQLSQALMNLSVNARDAMPQGGRLHIVLDAVDNNDEFRARHPKAARERYARFTVRDDGEGMDEKTLNRIFEPFFTTKEQGKGTGLGLAMVFGFVDQAGGFIEVDSTPGEGSVFRVYLPVSEHGLPETNLAGREDLMARGETVLVAEDDDALRRLLTLTLEDLGYRVIAAANGFEALELEDDHEGPIHLVLSDVVMPGMKGFELASILRVQRPDAKVVMMSGYPARGEDDDSSAPEGVPLLKKPIQPETLAGILRETLDTC